MFRWADVIAVAAVATLAAALLAAADRPIAGAPLDLVLPVEAVDLAVSSLDGGMSIHTNRVTLQSDVLFAFDSATLSASARGRIGGAALELAARRPQAITIDGYTDSRGSRAYNLRLSRRRAEAVRDVLVRALAARDVTVEAVGRGEAAPVAMNATAGGRARNRRVEVHF